MNNRWTDEQKKAQSEVMKARWAAGGCGKVGGTNKPKSESHKAALSEALKGRTLPIEQRHAVGFTAILKYNPDCKALSYQDLLDKLSMLVKQGFTSRTIADKLGIKHLTAKKVMKKNKIEYTI